MGRFAGKWFWALRIKIGKLELTQRLNPEHKCFKNRSDAIADGVKVANLWSKENLKDLAAGFSDSFNSVIEANKEKVE